MQGGAASTLSRAEGWGVQSGGHQGVTPRNYIGTTGWLPGRTYKAREVSSCGWSLTSGVRFYKNKHQKEALSIHKLKCQQRSKC